MTDREKFEAYFAPIAESMKKCGVGAVGIARRKDHQWQGWQAAIASKQPADEDWIEWAGGECPVPKGTLVDIRMRDGSMENSAYAWGKNDVVSRELAGSYAGWAFWLDENDESDIIAYRVVKP